jgi:hypothetical protein
MPGMGEQFDGLDIGVAVDDTPGHDRACIGLLFRYLAEPRHEPGHDEAVKPAPQEEWQHQAPVGRGHQNQCRYEIDNHENEDVEDLHYRLAHRERGLHHLGRDAASEFIAEEVHRLAQHLPVHPPARAHRHIAHQALVDDQRMDQCRERQGNQHHTCHEGEPGAFALKKALPVSGGQPIDDPAKETEQGHLAHGDERGQGRRDRQPRHGITDVIPDERPEAVRRHIQTLVWKRSEAVFKEAEHDPPIWRARQGETTLPGTN